ncbi:MAG: GNAT family N-acetyltransferase [Flavobacterium sp.]|jgi:ribosomal protein S18 acetylase RimI-like enzyme|uniref:GNAT family N-acetyltransferase n=1 Tax=Flavobacterium TaxID=237 RepID=UPI000C18CBC5|nr:MULTISPECIES: GNAT family N-acetyltransferase [Flavobacterium]MDI5888646.1 GNAT family N-acetyltransferase [Flavobacterium yafengii]MDP3679203.1 GNAT family N-acetyltransferase [Flavobacterium sp.]MDZ4329628.1 GNAT family N-acetyltransferase [Flavobacterium sp.]PIF62921.1 acetyltransferase (GNAT) family protein [Flavobacterium sp. 11]WKL43981.1 GNAT family N-acetyltransferase [Flavobacterium sp. ZE23DGlu08]
MSLDNTVEIIPFSTALKEPIKTLNLEWLKKYFKVEPKDEIVLSDPQGQIIDKGGMIFYAKYNDAIVGTVSLMKIDSTTYELSKMAVTDGVQGLGVGKKLMLHCLAVAEAKGIEKLILYSNRRLLPAIHLYEKFGFVEVPLEGGVYERADIKMERIMH